MGIEPIYWMFAIPGLLLSIFAQIYVKTTFNKYSKEDAESGKTGLDAAEEIKKGENFSVDILPNRQPLGDYFDPTQNIVAISSENMSSKSVSNIAVVAHEMGHVQQKFSASGIYNFRRTLVPITNIGTNIGYILFFIGLLITQFKLAQLGLILFSTGVLFSLITIPVELDASKRGMKFIEKYNLITEGKRGGAREVLNAAALTYFAGLVSSILNLMYYASLLNSRQKRR
ncbi:zinc metallopeptidase [Candidatus Dojkabacteria bacterium]|jgi:Zn-dependent membrane protease YugP|nr:zinc metallopeptidase [Candidatus Dojkabacteria bacterium]